MMVRIETWPDKKGIDDALAAGVPVEAVDPAQVLPEARAVAGMPVEAQRPRRGALVRRLSTVTPGRVSWLWPGRVPIGKITGLAGRPGLGKSLLALELAAAVTRGRPLVPGEEPCLAGGVVLLAGEDGLEDTVVPRLLEAGADLERIVAIDGIAGPRGERGFTLAEDLSELEAVVDGELGGDCRLIIIDPPAQFLGRPGQVDAHRDADVRAVLGPLAALAERRGLAVLLVTHHRKSAGATADQAISGSLAFGAAARALWHVTPDPEDRLQRLLLAGKSNLGPQVAGLRFRVDGAGAAPRIAWLGSVDAAADDFMLDQARPARRLESAADWLRARLQAGPIIASVVKQEGREAGYPERTLDRARVEIGATAAKDGMQGPWVWSLPQRMEDLAPSGAEGQENPWLSKAPRFEVLGVFEGAKENEESPWLQKAPNISVGEVASSGAGAGDPSPANLDQDLDRLEVWL